MDDVVVPREITIGLLSGKKSLSPSNYKKPSVPRESLVCLRDYLDPEKPFLKGIEPASSAYVELSDTAFLRNSCITQLEFGQLTDKYIYLNPDYGSAYTLADHDVLLCKDANIGDSCLFMLGSEPENTSFSSGVVKLNFKEPNEKYFVLAMLRDAYFRAQLDVRTPRGSTIRHSGDRFLDCQIPALNDGETWVLGVFTALVCNSATAEQVSSDKLNQANSILKSYLLTADNPFVPPTISEIFFDKRLDASFYSPLVQHVFKNIRSHSGGNQSLEEFGFELKRGPNLAKRDLGRSVKSKLPKPNYHLLVYPSDISSNGYILKSCYLGARNKVWHLGKGDILFSAEGTVGRVFVVCDDSESFTRTSTV